MNNPVNWFEIPVTDMDRAKQFYESVFGYEININKMGDIEMGWFPFDHEAPGATGTLIKNENYIPSHQGSLVYFSVPEIDEIMPIGEHGFCGIFEDTEGNRVALHQGVSG
jgi:uncharacterized protein